MQPSITLENGIRNVYWTYRDDIGYIQIIYPEILYDDISNCRKLTAATRHFSILYLYSFTNLRNRFGNLVEYYVT